MQNITRTDKNRVYLKRESLFKVQNERLDKDINLGYDYRNNLYKNYTSDFLQKIDIIKKSIPFLENMMLFLIDKTKEIKKTFAYAVAKNSRNIN